MRAQPPVPAAIGAADRSPTGADAGLVSGEAVELDVRAARLGSRVLALLLDVTVQLVLVLLLAMALAGLSLNALPGMDGALLNALATVLLVLLLVGYPVLFERFNNGRTPGKMAVGLRVVSADGGPVGVRQSLSRALVGVAVEWPGLVLPLLSWVAGVAAMLTDRRGRRLGDLVAGTMVVHTRTQQPWLPAPMIVPPLTGWAVNLDLTRLDDPLALAVRQYLTRAHRFAEPSRTLLGRALWSEVAAATTPPPPPRVPEALLLAAVLAERNRRGALRLRRSRTLTAGLWPELAPAPAAPAVPVGKSPDPAPSDGLRPAVPAPRATPAPPA
ncbi:RDD family protein [Micromonospora sp. URMC 105]|uniref:RDD family protein n=1 Tax=Micromonospora sp. URMC 105 TaxID=3423413 RepID=UPI003F1C2947